MTGCDGPIVVITTPYVLLFDSSLSLIGDFLEGIGCSSWLLLSLTLFQGCVHSVGSAVSLLFPPFRLEQYKKKSPTDRLVNHQGKRECNLVY